ncbi:MAG: preprotein translocase subunit SecG [Gemmatimonadaceae bacterium]|nr:preprotein translocase subunit SecG [Gemmatimonadaceae bacterium]
MLYSLLLVILVLDAIVLIGAILLQAGKGSGLSANFGGASSSPDAFIGIRQAGTILTKATWYCAGIFLGLSFILQLMSSRTRTPRSVLEDTFGNPPASAAPAPVTGAPAIPLEPAGKASPNTAPALESEPSAPGAPAATVPPATNPPAPPPRR